MEGSEVVQITMELSVYASADEVASQALAAFHLAGGGRELPEPLEGEEAAAEPAMAGMLEAPLEIMPLGSGAQPDSDLGPIPRVGYPGIRVEEEPPPREPPAEPFPEAQPEGP